MNMKTLKITTHWSTEEADIIYRLLDDLQTAIWDSYGKDIEQMYHGFQEEQLELNMEEPVFDEIPF